MVAFMYRAMNHDSSLLRSTSGFVLRYTQ